MPPFTADQFVKVAAATAAMFTASVALIAAIFQWLRERGDRRRQDGTTYNVTTTVNVQVAASADAATATGAQNVIGLTNGNATQTADSIVKPRSLSSAISGQGPDTGIWNIHNLTNGIAAHEFTHLLGVGDRTSGAVLSNTNILNDASIPHSATSSDLRWALSGVIGTHRSLNSRHDTEAGDTGGIVQRGGRLVIQSGSSVQTVQAPWRWWK